MIDPNVITKLREQAQQVKETCRGMRGSVTFHLGDKHNEVKVDVHACDVAKVKP
jgi:hypothetical protein